MRLLSASFLKNKIVLISFLAVVAVTTFVTAARAGKYCVTAEQFYQGQVDAALKYCTLETKIAAAKYLSISPSVFDDFPFNNKEKKVIRDRYQFISFINIAKFAAHSGSSNTEFPEIGLGAIELGLAALVVEISETDLDKTHELLLYGYLFTLRRQLLEDYLGNELVFLKTLGGTLLKNDAKFVGLQGNPDTFYLCYWRTYIPGREVLETVKSPLFLDCTQET